MDEIISLFNRASCYVNYKLPLIISVNKIRERKKMLRNLKADAQRIRRRLGAIFDVSEEHACHAQNLKDCTKQTILYANKILQNQIDVFQRSITLDNSSTHRDFMSGFTYPKSWPSSRIRSLIGEIPDVDIRNVWELNRLQHLTILGKAYLLTNRDDYVKKFEQQLTCWIEANPVGLGPNWVNAMEPAIRSCNILLALAFLKRYPFSRDFWKKLLITLYEHGVFIVDNLEYESRTNHLISNFVGLLFLGAFFYDVLPEGKEWLNLGYRGLLNEVKYQVLESGVHYEGSTSYHAFVTEQLLYAVILLMRLRLMIPEWFSEKLHRMLLFIASITKPNGLIPLIGDNDSGTLYNLSMHDPRDKRHILAIGSVLFNDEVLAKVSKGLHEEVLWFLGIKGLSKASKLFHSDSPQVNEPLITECSGTLSHKDFYVIKEFDDYLILRVPTFMLRAPKGHMHCDALSYEISMRGTDIIVDPGTYTYTGNIEDRNLFRSACYHNVIVIDDIEPCTYSKKEYFSPMRMHKCRLNFANLKNYAVLDAGQYYNTLSESITHRRAVIYNKIKRAYTIKDMFYCRKHHDYTMYMHLSDKIKEVEEKVNGFLINSDDGKIFNINIKCKDCYGIQKEVIEGYISPFYGAKLPSYILKICWEAEGTNSIKAQIFHLTEEALEAGKSKLDECCE